MPCNLESNNNTRCTGSWIILIRENSLDVLRLILGRSKSKIPFKQKIFIFAKQQKEFYDETCDCLEQSNGSLTFGDTLEGRNKTICD